MLKTSAAHTFNAVAAIIFIASTSLAMARSRPAAPAEPSIPYTVKPRDKLIVLSDTGLADGASGREDELDFGPGPAVLFHSDDVGDDLPGLFDDHPVANLQAEPIEFLSIVNAGARDGRPRDLDRSEVRHRGQRARLADLNIDRQHLRTGFVFLPLIRRDPAGRLRGIPQLIALGEQVDLHDQSIDFDIETVQVLHHRVTEFDRRVDAAAGFDVRSGGHADRSQPREILDVCRERFALDIPTPMSEEPHLSGTAQLRIEQLERPSCGVARIGKGFLATVPLSGDKVTEVSGTLTLLGKTNPVTLKASNFSCYTSPMLKREVCGGDFEATLQRSQWGVVYAMPMAAPDSVRLLVQVEAVKQ